MQKGRVANVVGMVTGLVVGVVGLVIVNDVVGSAVFKESLNSSLSNATGSSSTAMVQALVSNIPVLFAMGLLMTAASWAMMGTGSSLGNYSSSSSRRRRYADDLEEIAESLGKRYYDDDGLPPLWIQMWQDQYGVKK